MIFLFCTEEKICSEEEEEVEIKMSALKEAHL